MSADTNSKIESHLNVPVDLHTQAELACAQMSETLTEWRKLLAFVRAIREEAQVTRAASALAVPESQNRRAARPAEATSMTLSIPNAINVMLCATMPEAIATAASIAIQPTLSHSSQNACRISFCH
jgi:hypothetical protein